MHRRAPLLLLISLSVLQTELQVPQNRYEIKNEPYTLRAFTKFQQSQYTCRRNPEHASLCSRFGSFKVKNKQASNFISLSLSCGCRRPYCYRTCIIRLIERAL